MEQSLQNEIVPIKDQVASLVVSNNKEYEFAATIIKKVKEVKKKIKEFYKPMKEKAYQAHKEISKKESEHLDSVLKAELILNEKMTAYLREVKKREEEDRKKREAEAKKEAEERALSEAENATPETAENILNQAIEKRTYVPPQDMKPKVDGIHTRKSYSFTVTDINRVDRAYLCINAIEVGRLVRSIGLKAENIVGGIKVFEKETIISKK